MATNPFGQPLGAGGIHKLNPNEWRARMGLPAGAPSAPGPGVLAPPQGSPAPPIGAGPRQVIYPDEIYANYGSGPEWNFFTNPNPIATWWNAAPIQQETPPDSKTPSRQVDEETGSRQPGSGEGGAGRSAGNPNPGRGLASPGVAGPSLTNPGRATAQLGSTTGQVMSGVMGALAPGFGLATGITHGLSALGQVGVVHDPEMSPFNPSLQAAMQQAAALSTPVTTGEVIGAIASGLLGPSLSSALGLGPSKEAAIGRAAAESNKAMATGSTKSSVGKGLAGSGALSAAAGGSKGAMGGVSTSGPGMAAAMGGMATGNVGATTGNAAIGGGLSGSAGGRSGGAAPGSAAAAAAAGAGAVAGMGGVAAAAGGSRGGAGGSAGGSSSSGSSGGGGRANSGGSRGGYAEGGPVSKTEKAQVHEGEFVIKKEAVEALGEPLLQLLNHMRPEHVQSAIAKYVTQLIGEQGRAGDTKQAHVAPGEVVIPKEVLTPELLASLETTLLRAGQDPRRYVVGSPEGSYNPITGKQEFFLGGALKALAPVVGGVVGGFVGDAVGLPIGLSQGIGAGLASWASGNDPLNAILQGGLTWAGSGLMDNRVDLWNSGIASDLGLGFESAFNWDQLVGGAAGSLLGQAIVSASTNESLRPVEMPRISDNYAPVEPWQMRGQTVQFPLNFDPLTYGYGGEVNFFNPTW